MTHAKGSKIGIFVRNKQIMKKRKGYNLGDNIVFFSGLVEIALSCGVGKIIWLSRTFLWRDSRSFGVNKILQKGKHSEKR